MWIKTICVKKRLVQKNLAPNTICAKKIEVKEKFVSTKMLSKNIGSKQNFALPKKIELGDYSIVSCMELNIAHNE